MFAYQGGYGGKDPLKGFSLRTVWQSVRAAVGNAGCSSDWEDDDGAWASSPRRSSCSFSDGVNLPRDRGRRGRRVPSMNKRASTSLVIPPLVPSDRTKYTIVLDLDETLAYGRQGPVIRRPHLAEFLRFLGNAQVEVVVWTAGVRLYAQRLVAAIDPHGVIQHCIYRHEKWYPRSPYESYTKNLTLTGRHPDRTLIIDNTPDCMMRNSSNGIVCADFVGGSGSDPSLVALRDIISELVSSELPVPRFLSRCGDLEILPVCDLCGDEYNAYFLDLTRWGGPKPSDTEEVSRKTNRDWVNPDAAKAGRRP